MASQLDLLRAEVRRAHRNATNKVSRLRGQGVEVGGTNVDPRRNLKNVNRYTERQLRTYLRELDSFRDRGTSFRAGARGSTISGAKWREYQALERQYNKIAERSQEAVSQIRLTTHGMTIGERDAMLRNTSPAAKGQRRPLDPIRRNVRGIESDRALDKLIGDMRKRLSPSYEKTQVNRQRRIARQMTQDTGTARFRKGINRLSNKQFNILWNYTNFANLLSQWYETRQSDEDTPEWVASTRDDAGGTISDLLAWAAKQ